MKCKNCGAELPDSAKFCVQCGAKVERKPEEQKHKNVQEKEEQMQHQSRRVEEELQYQREREEEELLTEDASGNMKKDTSANQEKKSNREKSEKHKKKKGTFLAVTVAAALMVFLISSVLTGFLVSKNTDKKNAQLKAEIEKELNTYLDFCDKASAYKEKFQKLYLPEAEQFQLKKKMTQAEEYITERAEKEQLEKWFTDMDSFISNTEKKSKQYVDKLEEKFSEYDTALMTEEEEKKFDDNISKFKEYVNNKDYASAVNSANESYKYGEKVTEKKYGWNVSVVQQDISSYPTIRLYMDITDDSEQVVENLDKKYFILSEKQGSDVEYVKQKITKATQLNQAERLNISMVADVSGSMDENMSKVQQVMANFLNNVQFEVGDEIELSCFDDEFEILHYFTNDRQSLVNQVNHMQPDGMTKLYDSLIEAAQRAYLQEGARCVIAFTDGMDNCSSSTEEDVIQYAKQYNIPIFIIGIGVDSYVGYNTVLQRIAEETGGFYRDVEDVSASLEEVYNAIYRQQKEIYCLEYQTSADIREADTRNIHLYLKGEEYGGETDYSYSPKEDYFSVLLGKMLNAYSRSVENKDYSYIEDSDTVQLNSEIDKSWRGYVKQDSLELSQILYYDVLNLKFEGADTCIMTTKECYDISQTKNYNSDIKKKYKDNKNIDAPQIYDKLMWHGYMEDELNGKTIEVKKTRVLKGTYRLVRTKEGNWKFKDFAANYVVQSSDVYEAYVEGDSDKLE